MKIADCQVDKILDIIIDLYERGFDHDFVLEGEYIRCIQFNEVMIPNDFEVLETYSCDHKVYKQLNCILCGVQLVKHGIKGILMANQKSIVAEGSFQLMKKISFKTIAESVNNTNL